MAVDRWGSVMARKAEPSTESIAAAERAAAAARIHQSAGVSYVPPRSGGVGSVASGLRPDPPDTGEQARQAIEAHWQRLRGADGPLGNPIPDLQPVAIDRDGGRATMFEG